MPPTVPWPPKRGRLEREALALFQQKGFEPANRRTSQHADEELARLVGRDAIERLGGKRRADEVAAIKSFCCRGR